MRHLILLLALLSVELVADEALFHRWDKDQNGQLSREEVSGPMRIHFDRVDTDGSKTISLGEHNAAFAFVRRAQATAKKKGAPKLPGLDLRTNVAYAATDNPRQRLDLALPKKPADDALPVLVYVHGGAWRTGSKEMGWNRLKPFAGSKLATASVGYRLSDEATWPAQIHDCKAAIRWLKGNAGELGIDPNRIVVFGSSAGGHLVSLLGVSAGISELDGSLGPHADHDTKVAGVINFFGPTGVHQLSQLEAADKPGSALRRLFGGPLSEHGDAVRLASPLTHVQAGAPPFIHFHGTKDSIVPFSQSELMHAALGKVEASSALITIDGGGHGFHGQAITKTIQQFLDHTLFESGNPVTDVTLAANALNK